MTRQTDLTSLGSLLVEVAALDTAPPAAACGVAAEPVFAAVGAAAEAGLPWPGRISMPSFSVWMQKSPSSATQSRVVAVVVLECFLERVAHKLFLLPPSTCPDDILFQLTVLIFVLG